MKMAMPRRRGRMILLLWTLWAAPAAITSSAVVYRGWNWMTVTSFAVMLLHAAYLLGVTTHLLTKKGS